MDQAEAEAYDVLCAYTLTHGDPRFIHQHVVDAWAAQQATAASKPIGVCFALVGLFLHVELAYTGRAVQQVHQRLARRREQWPVPALPEQRGAITVRDVMAVDDAARDATITRWCASVWGAYAGGRAAVIRLLQERQILTVDSVG